ncbi:hypothetical protein GCM10025865_19830 [Paraoerskovia sediminicola]|uniref:Polyketide cyclase / dehydrase and lipid transport n=1 Tax=Paraoerskovia sediminicola TaxID=1138587 RepID=A0ABM8G3L6_9CELL|nr:hypothetical protein [Paraoerskovia sediminicola]BDZ42684.1 hypothetical protein GCM10025865_19830 [Paraoerskovia sediminicola]
MIRKTGPILLGVAGFEVTPTGSDRCVVTWWESVHLAGPLPAAWTRPPLGVLLRVMMRVGLRRLARVIEDD